MTYKKATNLDEQIQILKDRGLDTLYDKDDVKKYLFDIGYYRLGFYFFPFQEDYPDKKNRTHIFKSGYSLGNALNLYDFDFELRKIVLGYIQKIEISFKTKVIYICSLYYKGDPIWYLNYKNVHHSFISKTKKNYNDKYKIHSPISNHHLKYPSHSYAPAWKLIEFFTFGETLMLFNSLKSQNLQIEISKSFNINYVTVFENYLTRIVTLRNICSHNNILFDHRFEKSIKQGPAIKINNDNHYKVYSGIKIINYLHNQLPCVEKDLLLSDIKELIKEFQKADDKLIDLLDEFVKV